MHSLHSWDGNSTIEEMCVSAIKKNVSEICFTEHLAVWEGDICYGTLHMNKYNDDIEKCRSLFENKLIIRKGLEIGEPHLRKEKIQPFVLNQGIDFIIGSVHNIAEEDLPIFIKGKEQIISYMGYFEELLQCVVHGDMDVIGHFDLLRRYAFDLNGEYKFASYKELIHEILKKAIEKNIGLEINTSGLRSTSKEAFPSQQILKAYKSLGGKILTVGSDSHSADMIGNNISSVYKMLKEMDFHYVFSFHKRQGKGIKI